MHNNSSARNTDNAPEGQVGRRRHRLPSFVNVFSNIKAYLFRAKNNMVCNMPNIESLPILGTESEYRSSSTLARIVFQRILELWNYRLSTCLTMLINLKFP